MPLLVIPLLILGAIVVLGLLFALVAALVKLLFVPALILIAILFWRRRDRQPQHHSRTRDYMRQQMHPYSQRGHNDRKVLHDVQEKTVKTHKEKGHDWDDF